jgi:hypothetical protein
MLAFAVLTAALHVYLYRELQHDDAYITFRYARNLARGRGFVFNEGERMLGTSSPLFTLLMALPQALGIDVRWAALVVNAAALRLAAGAVFVVLRREHFEVALAAFVFGCVGGYGLLESSLLETFTVAALGTSSVAAFVERRMKVSGLLLGLAFLARHDAFLFVPLLAGASWLRDRKLPTALLGVSLATVTPWLVFATVYFGSPFPRTLAAKALLSPFGDYLGHYLALIYRIGGVEVPWVVGVALSAGGLAVFVRRRSLGAIVLVLHAVLHLLTYAAIGPPEVQHWHNFVPMMELRVALLAGLVGWIPLTRHRRRLLPIAAAGVLALCGYVAFRAQQAAQTVATQFWLGQRHERYVAVAHYVDEHVPPGRMMASEVGTLGYLTDRTMIDVFGLVSETNDFPRTQSFVDLIDLVERYRPEVLLMDDPAQGRLLADATEYELVYVFPWKRPWSTLLVRRQE